ncbi:MAG TPA: histidine kinase dimerization/phosphoacceptor domain -containing protein [Spirochaetota bacterium]|nr:histidine kinase dimerization/phosphoacceptor domain -containing protein [Spirochaetota bacterium]
MVRGQVMSEGTSSPGKTILYVEDSDLMLRAGMKVLENAGYHVVGIGSGNEAVRLAIEDPRISLVLMDIELGENDIDGTEAARRILARREIPIIFLTAHSRKEYVEKVSEITRYGYVIKNSGDFVLISSIEMAYKLFDATMEARELGQKYRNLYHYAQVGLFETDTMTSCLVACNQRFCDLLGLESVEKALGRTVVDHYVEPADRETVLEVLRNEGSVTDHVVRMRNIVTGRAFWVQFSASLDPKRGIVEGTLIDVDEQKKAQSEIQRLLAEKEILLKEVHHRVKNNMGTIVNLLSLQAGSLKEQAAIDALHDAKSRVQSMAVLYDRLYRSEGFVSVPINEYLGQLVDDIVGMFSLRVPVRIHKEIASFVIDTRKLFAVGIIVNELITNCLKYAFVDRTEGEILVSANRENQQAVLVVADNGRGLPEGFSPGRTGGFGLRLVDILVRQIEGSLTIERKGPEGGARFVIAFSEAGACQ